MFRAILLQESDGKITAGIQELDEARLPDLEGAVTVAVEYSTLNYKDGMILTGLGRGDRAPIYTAASCRSMTPCAACGAITGPITAPLPAWWNGPE